MSSIIEFLASKASNTAHSYSIHLWKYFSALSFWYILQVRSSCKVIPDVHALLYFWLLKQGDVIFSRFTYQNLYVKICLFWNFAAMVELMNWYSLLILRSNMRLWFIIIFRCLFNAMPLLLQFSFLFRFYAQLPSLPAIFQPE